MSKPAVRRMTYALPGVLLMLFCLLQSAYGLANLSPGVRDPANFLPPRIRVGADLTTTIKPSRPQTLNRQATASAIPEWLSREPLGESESINLYSYCHNDPVNFVDVLGLYEINTQEAANSQRVEWLLMQLSAGTGLPTAPLDEWKLYFPESGDFGLHKPYGPEDYKSAQTFVQNLGRPSLRSSTWEEAEAAKQPSFGPAPEWIPSLTGPLTLGGANTPLNAEMNSGFLLPTGAGAAGAKFLFGGMKSLLPILAAGARTEGRLLTTEMQLAQIAPELATSKTVYHTVTNPNSAHGILNGIDPAFLNPKSRFGKAFYTSDDAGTTLMELFHHNASSTHTIRFDLNIGKAKILDLANPAIAKTWGYTGGPISDATKAIGQRAISAGYNVIKVPSLRGPGTNFGVLFDFDDLLKPQGIVPAIPTP